MSLACLCQGVTLVVNNKANLPCKERFDFAFALRATMSC